MANETTGSGQPGFEPLPGWPSRPEDRPDGEPGEQGRPPSAPPPGWTGARPPWAEPPPSSPTPARPAGEERGGGRPGSGLDRRKLALAVVPVVLLAVAVIVVFVITSGSDQPGGRDDGGGEKRKAVAAPTAVTGKEIPLLENRLVVVAPPGWEQRESSPDTATLKVELRSPGRELLGTLVMTAIPGGGSLESTLEVDGGSRFDVTAGGGRIEATAVPSSGSVRAAAVRPSGSFFLSLSVAALDGNVLDAHTLQKLFTEQVAPQLRFP